MGIGLAMQARGLRLLDRVALRRGRAAAPHLATGLLGSGRRCSSAGAGVCGGGAAVEECAAAGGCRPDCVGWGVAVLCRGEDADGSGCDGACGVCVDEEKQRMLRKMARAI